MQVVVALAPKHIALPMTIKSNTGCAETVTLLNRLGNGISYSYIEELETAMAMRQVKRYENGSVLPSNAQPGASQPSTGGITI